MTAPSQPQKSTYDVIVIGAGIQGSFTAYHLAQRHRDTLLLEQFLVPHSRGSSHGQSRIIRSAYPQEYYSRMMPDCFRLWQQLEAETGTTLYRQTGLVLLGPPGEPELEACRRNLGVEEVLDAAALSRRFPGFQMQAGQVAVLDSTAGVLFADRALRAVQEVFRRHGGTLRDGEKVLSIQPGATVTVTTTAGVYKAPRLIITAGAWTGAFVEQLGLRLPLQPLRINVCYWREKQPGSAGLGSVSPCFLTLGLSQAPHGIYGLPSIEYPGMMKVCHHHGSPTDPDKRDQAPRSDIALLSSFISSYLPGLESQPAVMETCLYTNTPDEDFILDRHPKFSNIVIGAGFSGHGFKLAPVVGKLLCELSLGEEPSYNMAHFAITRFPGVLGAAQWCGAPEVPPWHHTGLQLCPCILVSSHPVHLHVSPSPCTLEPPNMLHSSNPTPQTPCIATSPYSTTQHLSSFLPHIPAPWCPDSPPGSIQHPPCQAVPSHLYQAPTPGEQIKKLCQPHEDGAGAAQRDTLA